MRVSAKAEYACIALIELAIRHQRQLPTSLKLIAEQYGISQPFLMQIFLQLKGAGLVTSVRGAGGGYQLSRSPDAITLADIVDTIDGPPGPSATTLPQSPVVGVLQGIWARINTKERELLKEISLANLQRQSEETGVTNYQI